MPPLIKTKVGNIDVWVRQGPQAAWDVGTSHCIISNDEYALGPFVNAPVRHKVHNNPATPGFLHENQCVKLVNELKYIWSPASQTLATAEDLEATSRLDGKSFEYHRVGYDHRTVRFRDDGTFAKGAARCEQYWTMRDGAMQVATEDGQLTMQLAPAKHGTWEGQWLNNEKMPVLLVP